MMLKMKKMMAMTMTTTMIGVCVTRMVDGASSNRMMQQGGEEVATNAYNVVPIGLNETKLSAVLPKPLSDFSSVYDAVNNKIYISGGCDSINGNQYAGGYFSCSNTSDHHYTISVPDLMTGATFTQLADMPAPRYRHTAILLPQSQQIVYVGGRSVVDDSIIPTVDIYDIETDAWTTHNVTNSKYLLSDNTGSEFKNRAYIFGGWNFNYTAVGTSFHIEIVNDALVFTDIPDLPTPRGDISSVSYTSPIATNDSRETFALVTGGFTHETLCNALDTAEIFNFNTETWTTEPEPLNIARGDKVLVRTSYSQMNVDYTQHLVYALGGERPIENFCEAYENETLVVGTETVPIDDIEYYNIQNDTWTAFPNTDIDVYRFRFSAVVDTSTNTIYTLGGQLAFDESCTCFPTSNEIYMYTEIFATSSSSPSSLYFPSTFVMMNIIITMALALTNIIF